MRNFFFLIIFSLVLFFITGCVTTNFPLAYYSKLPDNRLIGLWWHADSMENRNDYVIQVENLTGAVTMTKYLFNREKARFVKEPSIFLKFDDFVAQNNDETFHFVTVQEKDRFANFRYKLISGKQIELSPLDFNAIPGDYRVVDDSKIDFGSSFELKKFVRTNLINDKLYYAPTILNKISSISELEASLKLKYKNSVAKSSAAYDSPSAKPQPAQPRTPLVAKPEKSNTSLSSPGSGESDLNKNTVSKTYRIADNLSITIGGPVPDNYQPNWDNVITQTSSLANVKRPMIWDESKQFGKNQRDEFIAIGEYNGKAALYFYGYYACPFAGEIIIPSGKAILSGTPQTFEVQNFEKVFMEGNKCDATGPWRQFYDKFSASVTLSANNKGDISVSFWINTYSTKGELFTRIYADDLIFPIKNGVEKIKNLAASPYKDLANRLATEYHKGWKFHELYVPNSIGNISVMEKDKANNPLRIRVECQFNFYGQRDGWFDILINNKEPYGIVYSIEKSTCITPLKYRNGTVLQYSSTELDNIRKHQMTYLIGLLSPIMKERDEPTSCLVAATYTYYSNFEYDAPVYDLRGQQHMVRKTSSSASGSGPGLKNICKPTYYIKGINRDFTENSITILDISIKIVYGQIIEEVPILTQIPYADLLNFNKLCPNRYFR